MRELIRTPNIDFMGKKKYAFAVSGILLLLGILAFIQVSRGAANLGIDFAGGTAVQVQFSRNIPLQEVRSTLEKAGLKDIELQDFPAVNKVLVKIKGGGDRDLGEVSDLIVSTLSQQFADAAPEIDSVTEIGPKVGGRLKKDAIVATLFAVGGILLYVAFRFQFRFSIGATAATFHDVLAVLGIFWLMGKEINLIIVSALLIIAGYSLTDTVVVFDRIRENLRGLNPREPVEGVVNRSINEILSRTVITSATTLFASVALFLFGGEVIHDFALAITLGIIIGTFSSWFVASPVVLLMGGKKAFRRH